MKLFLLLVVGALQSHSCFSQAWFQVAPVILGVNDNDQFGWASDMSSDGTKIIIGSRRKDSFNSNTFQWNSTGAVQVYERNGTTISPFGSELFGEFDSELFGSSVAISGDGLVIAIGSPWLSVSSDSLDFRKGAVRTYKYIGADWIPFGDTLYGEFAEDRFGYSVALSHSGTKLVIGAPFYDNGLIDSGQTKVFQFNGASWDSIGNSVQGVQFEELSGMAVAMDSSGNRILIGSPYFDSFGNDRNGKVTAYDWNGNYWQMVGQNVEFPNVFGSVGGSLALSSDGDHFIASSMQEFYLDAFVFSLDGANWVQQGATIQPDTITNYFGWSVDISKEGKRVIIGAFENYFYDNRGSCRIYEWNGSDWSQFGQTIIGEPYSNLGTSVRISNDGEYIQATSLGEGWTNGASLGGFRMYRSSYLSLITLIPDKTQSAPYETDLMGRSVGDYYRGLVLRYTNAGAIEKVWRD